MEGCRHYWIISQPNGPVSHGVCKYCHEERDFTNSMPLLTSKAFQMQQWKNKTAKRSQEGK